MYNRLITTMKKIIFIITKGDVGGAQKYVADLNNNLDRSKFSVEILTGGKGGVRWLSNAFRPYFLFFNDWLALFELKKVLKSKNPDVIHLNSSKAGVIGAIAAKLASKKIKVVFTAHGWVFNPQNHNSWLRKNFYIFLHKFAGKFQDVIINVSEYDRQLALKNKIAPPAKLITIHNGVGIKNLKFLEKDSAQKALLEIINCSPAGLLSEARGTKEVKLEVNGPWIGSIGRLVKEKDYGTLIRAATYTNKNILFFIIGGGDQRFASEKLIRKHRLENRFFLFGKIKDAYQYLKAFDVFVLSSIKEGLPYTLIEAMSSGVPVIATKTGGIPEILSDRGYLVPPRRPELLAQTIEKALSDQKKSQSLSQKAREYAREHLSLEVMVEKTEKVY
jgi:glycosyltransferase involved in cell wall biosynthesis